MRHSGAGQHALVALEYFTGITALAGGLLLAARPDGSLLRAKLSALAGSPFADWRAPGVLLAVLVGGGFLLTAEWQRRHAHHARQLSIFAGLGLVVETTELAWIGSQPLEVLFAVVGAAVVVLAVRLGSFSNLPSGKVRDELTSCPDKARCGLRRSVEPTPDSGMSRHQDRPPPPWCRSVPPSQRYGIFSVGSGHPPIWRKPFVGCVGSVLLA